MRGFALAAVLCLAAGASALAQEAAYPASTTLRQAEADQATAEAEAARLQRIASQASAAVERLQAERAAAAQAIEAAEARITAANSRAALTSVLIESHRTKLAVEQRPVSSLLAGIAVMARRPPLLVLANRGGTDELVKVRLLLNATMPAVRARTERLSSEIADGERLRSAALSARAEQQRSRDILTSRRQQFAALERQALDQAIRSGSQALGASDVALSAGEDIERLKSEEANSQSIRGVAAQLALEEPAPFSPITPEASRALPPFRYQLPVAAPVTEGLSAVNDSGVRSRGLTLAAVHGTPVTAPADGIVRFSGPFNDYDGILIIDHGAGWLSLIANVGSELRVGERVQLGQPVGRAMGAVQVELSHNGRRISPALIAGSSASLSKG